MLGTCSCDVGWYGSQCQSKCNCLRLKNKKCNPESGKCECPDGYNGAMCRYPCPTGKFGYTCRETCPKKCFNSCNHVNGSCISECSGGNCLDLYDPLKISN